MKISWLMIVKSIENCTLILTIWNKKGQGKNKE